MCVCVCLCECVCVCVCVFDDPCCCITDKQRQPIIVMSVIEPGILHGPASYGSTMFYPYLYNPLRSRGRGCANLDHSDAEASPTIRGRRESLHLGRGMGVVTVATLVLLLYYYYYYYYSYSYSYSYYYYYYCYYYCYYYYYY